MSARRRPVAPVSPPPELRTGKGDSGRTMEPVMFWDDNHHNANNHIGNDEYDKEHKKGHSTTNVLRMYEHILSFLLLGMFFVTIGVLALFVLPHPTPGLLTPPDRPFVAVPSAVQRTVCIDASEQAVIRAFRNRGWTTVVLREENDNKGDTTTYVDCHVHGTAAVIWTKAKPKFWGKAQPWQRHNWLPFQNSMSRKSTFQRYLNNYTATTGQRVEFVPTSFVLPDDRERLLQRLQPSTGKTDGVSKDLSSSASAARHQLRSNSDSTINSSEGGGGDNEPWVAKLSATDVRSTVICECW